MQPGHTLQHRAQGGDGGAWQVDVCGWGEEDADFCLTFVLLESVGDSGSQEDLKKLENVWRDRLQSWHPLGLNTRDD